MVLQRGCKGPGGGAAASSHDDDDVPKEWSAWVRNAPKPKATGDSAQAMRMALQRNALQKLAHYCETNPEEIKRGVQGEGAVKREGWGGVGERV